MLFRSDLTSYSRKHNLANGEDNHDGRDDELCGNFGVEGKTADPDILERRRRVRRAMMATLLLAQGTPMLCAGDEIGNSQQGNNNAYCQDNPTAWLDWEHADHDFQAFVARLIALRRDEPLLHHDRWFASSAEAQRASVHWRLPNAGEIHIQDWHDVHAHALACVVSPAIDDQAASPALMLLFNPDPDETSFALAPGNWTLLLDSGSTMPNEGASLSGWARVPARSVLVLRQAKHHKTRAPSSLSDEVRP